MKESSNLPKTHREPKVSDTVMILHEINKWSFHFKNFVRSYVLYNIEEATPKHISTNLLTNHW